MFLQIIFAAILAIVIVVSAYRYLKWSVIVWLGGIIAVPAAVALFINEYYAEITWSNSGNPFIALGEHVWLAAVGLAAGLILMIAGVIKRIRMPLPEIAQQPVPEPRTEQQQLEQALISEINEVKSDLGDPEQRGESDAHSPGGTTPDRNATKPEGFEVETRDRYQALGDSFLVQTVNRLKQEINEALQQLANIRNKLAEKYYYISAEGEYSENSIPPDSVEVSNKRHKVESTGMQLNNFVSKLNLEKHQQPEWEERTTTNDLWLFGGLFILIEFGVSYFFLKDALGHDYAIQVAGVAVAIVFILAVLAAWGFRFTRRPTSTPIRAVASVFCTLMLVVLFGGLGLLLNSRSQSGTSEIGFAQIISGYQSIFDISNLVLFLINVIAFGLLYWKFLLHFERYNGYRKCHNDSEKAENDWHKMFTDNAQCITDALKKTSGEAKLNSKIAATNAQGLMEKCEILNNLQGAIAPAYELKLRPAYQQSVQNYRHSNAKHRNVKVNPVPEYFKKPAEFRPITEYFNDEHGINEFLAEKKDQIELADDTRKQVDESVVKWNNQRPELNKRLANEFESQVQGG